MFDDLKLFCKYTDLLASESLLDFIPLNIRVRVRKKLPEFVISSRAYSHLKKRCRRPAPRLRGANDS
jgi:hypothetical protein